MVKEKSTTGHVCELPPEVDSLILHVPGTGRISKLRRWFRNLCLASSTNTRCIALLHSKAAMAAERTRHVQTHDWIIHPYSKLRTIWECIMCVIYLMSFFNAPVSTTFMPENVLPDNLYVIGELFIDCMCLVDIIMTFNTGIIDKSTQEVILTPFTIARKYLLGYFIFDVLAAFPIEMVFKLTTSFSKHTYRYIALCNLFRIARCKTLHSYLGRTFEMFKMGKVSAKLLRIFTTFILFFHWMACLCFMVEVTVNEGNEEHSKSWIHVFKVWKDHVIVQYVHSMFHAVMSSNHVNYPHGVPKTDEDRVLSTILGLFGTVIFVYFVSTALQILYITNNAEFKYEEDTNQLKEFMRQKHLPEAFQKRLIDLNEFKFQKSFFREKNILNSLPGQLQQEILIHSCRHLVENVSFFNNLSSTMLVRLVMVLKSEIYLKNQEIIKIRTLGDCMYFISSGTVAVYSASRREVCHMQDGSHFGEMALLNPDRLRTASVVALEISEVYRLDRRDFVLIVAQFPDMVDQLKQIATERQEQLQRIDV